MFNLKISSQDDLSNLLKELLKGEKNLISGLANSCALINQMIHDISWVGFYILKEDKLNLGPFQGKVACSTINIGKGVCGACAKQNKIIVVDDVSKFEGHIACDNDTRSEIVLPIYMSDKLYGILDVDSKRLNRFRTDTINILKDTANIISEFLNIVK